MDYAMTNGDAEGAVIVENAQTDAVLGFHAKSHRDKLLIDTDPGIGEFFFLIFLSLHFLGIQTEVFVIIVN